MRKMCIQIAAAALAFATVVFAQTAHRAPAGPPTEGRVLMHSGPGGGVIGWTAAEMGPGGRAIKGSPYSATAVTEVVQTLADGNKIRRETTGAVYRDSEGRTRNETQVAGTGPVATAGLPQLITISDPVAGVSYVLNPDEKTAMKMPAVARRASGGGGGAPGGGVRSGDSVVHARGQSPEQVKTEQLGTKMFDGVQAEGTRITQIIPAGLIGNERPIEVVSERWISPQLQGIVMTIHSDPRMGTNTYRLTKINLGEPDHSLFEVPAGYKIVEGGMVGSAATGGVVIQRRPAAPRHEQ